MEDAKNRNTETGLFIGLLVGSFTLILTLCLCCTCPCCFPAFAPCFVPKCCRGKVIWCCCKKKKEEELESDSQTVSDSSMSDTHITNNRMHPDNSFE